ncbi:hypothetical protein, partial [Parabacteroides sp.]
GYDWEVTGLRCPSVWVYNPILTGLQCLTTQIQTVNLVFQPLKSPILFKNDRFYSKPASIS